MPGAPWNGLFYGFVIEVVIGIGALAFALQADDFLLRALAWALVAAVALLAARTIRRAARLGDQDEPPTGRWWFGG